MRDRGKMAREEVDRIYSQIIERLEGLDLSPREVHWIMSMVEEYGNAEIEAKSFCNQ